MKVRFADVESYVARAMPYLETDPVRCTVSLTVADSIRRGNLERYTLSVIEDEAGAVVGAVSWTPPFHLVLSPMPSAAIDAVVAAWAAFDVPGVVGPRELAVACGERLARLTDRTAKERFAERLFRLDEVIDVPRPAGNARPARDADGDLLSSWFDAFVREAGVTPGRDPRREVEERIASGRIHVWETDHGLVSFVSHTATVAGVCRVGPVYTPPDSRGRGFARALVAAVSRARLEAGDSACCLFTDLANPVSNAIYQQVGYRPVADYAQIDLRARDAIGVAAAH